MNDMLEGVCSYDMRHIIHYLVNKKKLMSFDVLNARIRGFDYGLEDTSNRPAVIAAFAKPSVSFNLKAAEMLRLVRYFALMVGDLVPEGDDVWGLYLILSQITQLVFSTAVTASELGLLRTLVSEHHELYTDLFGDSLKPKHHFMTHYPSAIQSLGPLVWLWSMRFESKHGEAKKTASVVCNFKNICKSLAQKHQMKFCYRLYSKESFTDYDLVVGPGSEAVNTDDTDSLLAAVGVLGQVLYAKWITLNGTTYRPGQTLLIGVVDDMPSLAELLGIFVDSSRTAYFVVCVLDTVGYSAHVNAYEVLSTCAYKCVKAHELLDYRPLHRRTLPNSPELHKLVTLHSAL